MWKYTSWGNSIEWSDFDKRTIRGWYKGIAFGNPQMYKLKIGDEVRDRMQSGKIACFLIVEIQYKSDPDDLFFGKVQDINYLEEVKSERQC